MFYVYKISNSCNNKLYIGFTGNPKRRWKGHKDWTFSPTKKKFPINRAMLKHGFENFKLEVIEEYEEKEEAIKREIYWIAHLRKSGVTLYNVTDGGEGVHGDLISKAKMGHSVSQETREKLRQANLGKKQSKETIRKSKEGRRIIYLLKNKERDDKIIKALREKKETRSSIAKRMNMTPAAISYIAKNNGFKMLDNKSKLSDKQMSSIADDIVSGMSYANIAKKHNIRRNSVNRVRNKLNLQSPYYRLNKENVVEIKHMLKNGATHKSIAKKYNVSKACICAISCGRNWGHVKIE